MYSDPMEPSFAVPCKMSCPRDGIQRNILRISNNLSLISVCVWGGGGGEGGEPSYFSYTKKGRIQYIIVSVCVERWGFNLLQEGGEGGWAEVYLSKNKPNTFSRGL
jgi:hypothetical protein